MYVDIPIYWKPGKTGYSPICANVHLLVNSLVSELTFPTFDSIHLQADAEFRIVLKKKVLTVGDLINIHVGNAFWSFNESLAFMSRPLTPFQ